MRRRRRRWLAGTRSDAADVTITSLNSDVVGHFTAAGVLALPIAWLSEAKVSLTGSGAASEAVGSPLALLRQFRAGIANAGGDRKEALEVIGTGDLPCNFGGTVSATIDDADNNGVESPGDVETLVFHNCIGSVSETYDGTVRMYVAEVTGNSSRYNVNLTQLSYLTAKHSLIFNGSYLAEVFATTDSVQNTTYTVNGSVTIALTTHVPFNDTVTLKDGFVVREQVGYGSGQNVLSASGRIESKFAGGSVDVSTSSPLTTPRSGQAGLYPPGVLKVAGKAGALSITALSATFVCVDVDTNDDGAIEATSTPSWEWLL